MVSDMDEMLSCIFNLWDVRIAIAIACIVYVFNSPRKVLIIRGRFLILREHRKKSDVSNHFLC